MTEGAKGGDALAADMEDVITATNRMFTVRWEEPSYVVYRLDDKRGPLCVGRCKTHPGAYRIISREIAARIREHMLSDASVERVARAADPSLWDDDHPAWSALTHPIRADFLAKRRRRALAGARTWVAALLDGGALGEPGPRGGGGQ